MVMVNNSRIGINLVKTDNIFGYRIHSILQISLLKLLRDPNLFDHPMNNIF